MLNKFSLTLLFLAPVWAFSQSKDSATVYDFGGRIYNTRLCRGCPMIKPGEKFPDSHPNAKYLNDTTLWEWKEGPYPGTKIYDLKPQYKDTLIRNDGSVMEVPVWLKDPNWVKPLL